MVCKHCGSREQKTFHAELVATFRGSENLRKASIYLCKATLICTNCGTIELKVSGTELEKFRQGFASDKTPNYSGNDSSLGSQ
jgi:hypothetical protein